MRSQVAMSQYVGVLLIVLVRRDVKDAVGEVQMSEKGIGLLGFGVSVFAYRSHVVVLRNRCSGWNWVSD